MVPVFMMGREECQPTRDALKVKSFEAFENLRT